MKRVYKVDWICEYLNKKDSHVDILNRQFVDEYIKEFNPKIKETNFGADHCNDLSLSLKMGYDMGIFERARIGLHAHEMGFPNWVYVYSLKRF